MDETVNQPGLEMVGFTFTAVVFRGKLYAEALEGGIWVKAGNAVLRVLDPVGKELSHVNVELEERRKQAVLTRGEVWVDPAELESRERK